MRYADNLLLNLYYYGSQPLRRWRNACRSLAGRAPVIVLFYHRIAEDRANAWTTSPRVFARHIRWLKKHFDMVSLAEAQQRIKGPRNERPAVSITFDDGYADNCRFALPLLLGQRIPVTYFVSTAHVLEGLPFLHDLKRGKTLAPNTPQEIRTLAEHGVEIGAHTRTHANLGRIRDSERLWYELAGGKEDLERLTGKPVRYFAFPFGQHSSLNRDAFRLARDCGYEAVCSAYGGYNFPGDDSFHLQRIHADNDMIRLKNWMTVDPRKVKQLRRFAYESAGPSVVAGAANS
jgi:peptidoglycan/xylan/chitin deacetylase (PgdA/CDA1 family)